MTKLMNQRGVAASRIAIGTWAIGGFEWGGTDRNDAISAIHAATDNGLTLIDTAPIYGFGVSEELVGEAIANRRDKVLVATKCGLVWDETDGEFAYTCEKGDIYRVLKPASIRRQVEESLRRLKIDHIDLYQTHFQDGTTPIADTMGTLEDLKSEGKIGAIGVCNVTPAQLKSYLAAGSLATDQEQYNMVDRQHEAELFPECRKAGIEVMAYSPLAMGLLSGKMGGGRKHNEGDVRGFSPRFAPAVTEPVNAFLARIGPIAESHGISVAQLVIAWTLARDEVTYVLSGMRNVRQAEENARAQDVSLTAEQIALIDSELAKADLRVPQVFG